MYVCMYVCMFECRYDRYCIISTSIPIVRSYLCGGDGGATAPGQWQRYIKKGNAHAELAPRDDGDSGSLCRCWL